MTTYIFKYSFDGNLFLYDNYFWLENNQEFNQFIIYLWNKGLTFRPTIEPSSGVC